MGKRTDALSNGFVFDDFKSGSVVDDGIFSSISLILRSIRLLSVQSWIDVGIEALVDIADSITSGN